MTAATSLRQSSPRGSTQRSATRSTWEAAFAISSSSVATAAPTVRSGDTVVDASLAAAFDGAVRIQLFALPRSTTR
ncbi:hypothetical protein QP185_19440 [Sphingomonas aerolata]|uniref:hypothetical protein n=1 Tax=Sphingomonas aerolata TaxID=185951 RepID=UPI002FE22ECA